MQQYVKCSDIVRVSSMGRQEYAASSVALKLTSCIARVRLPHVAIALTSAPLGGEPFG